MVVEVQVRLLVLRVVGISEIFDEEVHRFQGRSDEIYCIHLERLSHQVEILNGRDSQLQ